MDVNSTGLPIGSIPETYVTYLLVPETLSPGTRDITSWYQRHYLLVPDIRYLPPDVVDIETCVVYLLELSTLQLRLGVGVKLLIWDFRRVDTY